MERHNPIHINNLADRLKLLFLLSRAYNLIKHDLVQPVIQKYVRVFCAIFAPKPQSVNKQTNLMPYSTMCLHV